MPRDTGKKSYIINVDDALTCTWAVDENVILLNVERDVWKKTQQKLSKAIIDGKNVLLKRLGTRKINQWTVDVDLILSRTGLSVSLRQWRLRAILTFNKELLRAMILRGGGGRADMSSMLQEGKSSSRVSI